MPPIVAATDPPTSGASILSFGTAIHLLQSRYTKMREYLTIALHPLEVPVRILPYVYILMRGYGDGVRYGDGVL